MIVLLLLIRLGIIQKKLIKLLEKLYWKLIVELKLFGDQVIMFYWRKLYIFVEKTSKSTQALHYDNSLLNNTCKIRKNINP